MNEKTYCWQLLTRKSSCVNTRGIPPRRVVSTPSVVLTGYPPPSWPGWGGVPYLGTPLAGYPPAGYPIILTLPGGYPTLVPPQQGTSPGRVPLPLAGPGRESPPTAGPGRVPPSPHLPHGILGNVAKHYGIWVPPSRCGQTNKVKLLPFRRTTYAGGNNQRNIFIPHEESTVE